ncbi:MAG: UDP-N-acetylmuramoyl-L-alanyl-D-glutamate--2,6-diaminopimelate ligase [Nitrospiraceae bacterium]|nr:MAG: UDP-N-acetylmuramoyl-L-alanyl-D-glutamate--2,6-diaminopimelate ligase [Nitrospiraceae bacterium]
MTLSVLLEGLSVRRMEGLLTVDIEGIAYDSRSVKKDYLFVAVTGYSVDGHDFIDDAISRGAAAIITERAVDILMSQGISDQHPVALIEVDDSRSVLGRLSSRYYGNPSAKLELIGITGTNGKTTASFITKSILEAGGRKTGLLGTIKYITGDTTIAALNTTPESMDLQRYLRDMVNSGMSHAVMEISSHALQLRRVDGCSLKVAAFTNFTRDHLDFHITMDDYLDAKKKVFDYIEAGGTAVLNWDDPTVRSLAGGLDCNVVTCGTEEGAMIRAVNILSAPGLSFTVQTPEDEFTVHSRLKGQFNVSNMLIAIGIGYALDTDKDIIQQGIQNTMPVEGRFESVEEGQGFNCIVDYAHTEDALKKVLNEARHITDGSVITVFGCGGDRDRTKRPAMGSVASKLSDHVIITSDNPRTEDPEQIIADILPGMRSGKYAVCADRKEALYQAVEAAQPGDTVVAAGKGHENYQEIMDERYHFSDREVLREAIRKLKK